MLYLYIHALFGQDFTTVPPSYAEIPAVGTLGQIGDSWGSFTEPRATLAVSTQPALLATTQSTMTNDYQEATTRGDAIAADKTTKFPAIYNTSFPTAAPTTQASPSIVSTVYPELMTTTSADLMAASPSTTEKFDEPTTDARTPSPTTAMPHITTMSSQTHEGRHTMTLAFLACVTHRKNSGSDDV